MAASYHVRSNSFPSRPNPLFAQVDEQLNRLRSSETASTSSSSISLTLNKIQDLNECLEKLLQLPIIQAALSQAQNKKAVDELLDGSLRLLDVCFDEVKKYFASRKSLEKSFQKLLKSLNVSQNLSNDDDTLTMLREAQEVTSNVFGSVLSFISGSNMQSRKCSQWSLVSKLVSQKRVACQGELDANEFAKADASLQSLLDNKSLRSRWMSFGSETLELIPTPMHAFLTQTLYWEARISLFT